MLTPPNWCISVALCINRATCCIDTSKSYPVPQSPGFCGVLLAQIENKAPSPDGDVAPVPRPVRKASRSSSLVMGPFAPVSRRPEMAHGIASIMAVRKRGRNRDGVVRHGNGNAPFNWAHIVSTLVNKASPANSRLAMERSAAAQ